MLKNSIYWSTRRWTQKSILCSKANFGAKDDTEFIYNGLVVDGIEATEKYIFWLALQKEIFNFLETGDNIEPFVCVNKSSE